MPYEYTHADGRVGRGDTTWSAMVDAIGWPEANALPMFDPNVWDWTPADEQYSRMSSIRIDDQEIGVARLIRGLKNEE